MKDARKSSSSTSGGDDKATSGGGDQGGDQRSPMSGVGAAYIMVAAALLGVGLGYAIDAAAGTRPLWTLVCFFLFMIAGMYHMIREGRK